MKKRTIELKAMDIFFLQLKELIERPDTLDFAVNKLPRDRVKTRKAMITVQHIELEKLIEYE